MAKLALKGMNRTKDYSKCRMKIGKKPKLKMPPTARTTKPAVEPGMPAPQRGPQKRARIRRARARASQLAENKADARRDSNVRDAECAPSKRALRAYLGHLGHTTPCKKRKGGTP
jgi:hypothetical protein